MRSYQTQRRLLILAAFALTVAAGCGDGNDGESSPTPIPTPTLSLTATPTPLPMDLATNLTAFEFGRSSGLGFCPPLFAVFRAAIERSDDGVYRFRVSILQPPLVPTEIDDPECIPVTIEGIECARAFVVPERALTDDEVEEVHAAFRNVLLFEQPDPACTEIAFDPCVISGFTWRRAVGDITGPDRVSFSAGDYPCSASRLPPSEVDRITALLGRLANIVFGDDGDPDDPRDIRDPFASKRPPR